MNVFKMIGEKKWLQTEVEAGSHSEAMENKAFYVSRVMQKVPVWAAGTSPVRELTAVTLSFRSGPLWYFWQPKMDWINNDALNRFWFSTLEEHYSLSEKNTPLAEPSVRHFW